METFGQRGGTSSAGSYCGMRFRPGSIFLRRQESRGMYLAKLMPTTSICAPMFSRIRYRCPILSLPYSAAMGVSTSGLVKSRDVKWAWSRTSISRWMVAWRKPLCRSPFSRGVLSRIMSRLGMTCSCSLRMVALHGAVRRQRPQGPPVSVCRQGPLRPPADCPAPWYGHG